MIRKAFRTACMFCMVMLIWAPGFSQQWGREPVGESGYIDWSEMRAYATGVGIAPGGDSSESHRRILANRAAIVVAKRNLLEVVRGVRIDSDTVVENFMIKSDIISSKVNAVLEGASVEEGQHQRDGSCVVRVSVPLTGKLGEAVFVGGGLPAQTMEGAEDLLRRIKALEKRMGDLERKLSSQHKISMEQRHLLDLCFRMIAYLRETAAQGLHPVAYGGSEGLERLEKEQARLSREVRALAERLDRLEGRTGKTEPETRTAEKPKILHTGLVVDARGLGFRPCLVPEIYGRDTILYPRSDVDFEQAITAGYVRYYSNLGQAQRSASMGRLPYTVKAKRLYRNKKGCLDLEVKDAQYLESVLAQEGNFLRACKVIIVF